MAALHALPGIGHIIVLLVASGGGRGGFPRVGTEGFPANQFSNLLKHTLAPRARAEAVIQLSTQRQRLLGLDRASPAVYPVAAAQVLLLAVGLWVGLSWLVGCLSRPALVMYRYKLKCPWDYRLMPACTFVHIITIA